MQELTDDQLDGLFRKSAEEANPPFDPAAWQAAKNQLDAHDRATPGRTPWTYLLRWGLAALLLAGLTGIGWYVNVNRATRPATVGTASQRVAVNSRAALNQTAEPSRLSASTRPFETGPTPLETNQKTGFVPDGPKQPTERTEPVADVTQLTNRADRAASRLKRTETSRPKTTIRPSVPSNGLAAGNVRTPDLRPVSTAPKTRTGRAGATGLVARTKRTEKSLFKQNDVERNHRDETVFLGTGYALMTTPSFKKSRANPNPDYQSSEEASEPGRPASPELNPVRPAPLPVITELSIRPVRLSQPPMVINRPVAVQPDTASRVAIQKLVPQRGLSVRLLVSPDLSAVGLHNLSKPGTNVGLMLEYRLATRWSIQAGVLQSTKVYRALTTEYELPAYTSKWKVLPESVNGRCSMLDIPINLRYDVALRTAPDGQVLNRWFVSGGVTTYIMRQEDYDYNYADPTSPHIYPNMQGWHGSTGRYNLSHLNLSAGYERALGRRFSWQVEPFVKVPLRGVGYFKIDLLSTGAFLSLRYKL